MHGKTISKNSPLPKNIQLSLEERKEILRRANPPFGTPPTIARYWLDCYVAHGIVLPKDKVPVAVPTALPGLFRLEWHPKAIGPQGIAEGLHYQQFQEKRDAQRKVSGKDQWL